MRQALKQNRARAQTARAAPVPAPIGGWDTDSALASMPKQNAVILDNWITRGGYLQNRRGFVSQVTGFADPVQTLIPWRGSTDKLLACAGVHIYDVTSAGALGAALYTSAATAQWNSTNFANTAGQYAILVNGQNTPQKFDGTSISATAITGTSGSLTLTPSTLQYVMGHKSRLHFVEKGTLRVWFLGLNAIAGTANLLDLSGVFTRGGYLVGMGRLTLDGGVGPDDFACYVTNQGQVAVYQGLDPSDANNWSLVGVFSLPKPIGDRCLLDFGADLLLLTESGVLSLTQALKLPLEEQRLNSLSRYVTNAFATAATAYGANFGWQIVGYPGRGGLIFVNVPTAQLSTSQQYVKCLETGRWSRFTGLNAFCWANANGNIYFGSTAGVYQWDSGSSDNGDPIIYDMLPAFQDFGNRSVPKAFKNVRAQLRAPAIVQPAMDVVTDYDQATVPTDVQTTVSPGDLSPQDATLIRQAWTGASGSGYVGSPRMRISLTGSTDVARIAVTEDLSSLLLVGPGGTDHILVASNLPLDVEIQCVGFDLTYEEGSLL